MNIDYEIGITDAAIKRLEEELEVAWHEKDRIDPSTQRLTTMTNLNHPPQ